MKHILKTLAVVFVEMLILLFVYFFFGLASHFPTDTLLNKIVFGIFMFTGCVFIIGFHVFENRYGEPHRHEIFGDENIDAHADANSHAEPTTEKKSCSNCAYNDTVRYCCSHPDGNCIDQEDADKRWEPKTQA